jgi:hypothetical protein
MDIQEFANELKDSNAVRVEGNAVKVRKAALNAEKKAFLAENLPAIAALLSGRPESDFVEEEDVVFEPRVQAPSLDTQFANYILWLAGRGGAIDQLGHYYSPSQAEFDVMKERTKQVADANGGTVKLIFDYAHSWAVEVLSGPNIGAIYRIDRLGRINGVSDRGQGVSAA